MSVYLQTSTSNPYGHRPWQTRLNTGFEDFGFLKQPQNTIMREDFSIRPRIYRPPEMAGLGDGTTLVGGSGRILLHARRRGTNTQTRMLAGLGLVMGNGAVRANGLDFIFRRGLPPIAPVSQIRYVGPIGPITPVLPGPMPVWKPPVSSPVIVASPPPPITILPPSLMPPVPTPVASGPGGTIYALPGDATTPGSPFAPPPAGQLLPTGAVPVSATAAASAAAASASPAASSALADWFNSSTWISGVPNGYVAIGIAGAIFLFSKKKR